MNFVAPIDYPALLGALVVLNWPVYRVLFSVLFRDAAEAKESFFYMFVRSQLRSLILGEWLKQLNASAKAGLFTITIPVLICAEYAVVASVIDVFVKGWSG